MCVSTDYELCELNKIAQYGPRDLGEFSDIPSAINYAQQGQPLSDQKPHVKASIHDLAKSGQHYRIAACM